MQISLRPTGRILKLDGTRGWVLVTEGLYVQKSQLTRFLNIKLVHTQHPWLPEIPVATGNAGGLRNGPPTRFEF